MDSPSVPVFALKGISWKIQLNVANKLVQPALLSRLRVIVLKNVSGILKLMVTMVFAIISATIQAICMRIILPVCVFHLAPSHPATSQTDSQAIALNGVLMAISHRPVAEPALTTALLVSLTI